MASELFGGMGYTNVQNLFLQRAMLNEVSKCEGNTDLHLEAIIYTELSSEVYRSIALLFYKDTPRLVECTRRR